MGCGSNSWVPIIPLKKIKKFSLTKKKIPDPNAEPLPKGFIPNLRAKINQQRREKMRGEKGESRRDLAKKSERELEKNGLLTAPGINGNLVASRMMRKGTMGEDDMVSCMNKSYRRGNTKEGDSKMMYNESTGSILRDSSRIDASGTPGRRERRR